MVKAILYVKTDVEGRRLGYRTGLDTLVVLAENDECHKLDSKKGSIQVINYTSILFDL
jgi:hypothetical protein